MKATKTVAVVPAEPRSFEFSGKVLWAVDVTFDDGSIGSVVAGSEEQAKQHIEALLKIKGQEQEFDLESKGEYQGVAKWKMLSYPGKPAGGGGGGGGARREWVDNSPSIEAQVSMQQAIIAVGGYDPTKYENTFEYVGLIREIAMGLGKVITDVKTKVTGTPSAASTTVVEKPEQPALPTAAPSDEENLPALRQVAVSIFGTKAAATLAYKNMTGNKKTFDHLTTDDLDALIEFASEQEQDA